MLHEPFPPGETSIYHGRKRLAFRHCRGQSGFASRRMASNCVKKCPQSVTALGGAGGRRRLAERVPRVGTHGLRTGGGLASERAAAASGAASGVCLAAGAWRAAAGAALPPRRTAARGAPGDRQRWLSSRPRGARSGAAGLFVPRPRQYDDQAGRLSEEERAGDNLLQSALRRLQQEAPPPSQTPNGARLAAQRMVRLMGEKWAAYRQS